MPKSPESHRFYQPPLEGLHTEAKEETVLEHVIVESLPTYKKNGKGYAWDCSVYCPPDIFHQDRNETYEIHAHIYAPEARKKRLRPGDIVTLKGFAHTQEVQLSGGEERAIRHVTVTDIAVMRRAKRESITVYERKRGEMKAGPIFSRGE